MLIHQIWIEDIIPENIQAMMSGWRASGHTYKLWRKEDLSMYDDIIISTGVSGVHNSLKSDLYRLLILRDNGGLYVDCDSLLIDKIPDFQMDSFCGTFGKDTLMPDPWMIYASMTNSDSVVKLLNAGLSMDNSIDILHRFGYKAFIRRWTDNILDTSSWCKHTNLFSCRSHLQGMTPQKRNATQNIK